MQLRTVGGKATLLSRKGLDWSSKFPEIVAAGAKLGDGIIDGEVVALDHTGAPDFSALQAAISDAKTKDLVFFVLRPDVRRQGGPAAAAAHRAQGAPGGAMSRTRRPTSAMSTTSSPPATRSCCPPAGWSWRASSPSGSTRPTSPAAVKAGPKSKCRQGHEVVIGGWTTTGENFRSLICGVNREGELVHVGRVGTGFGRDTVSPPPAEAEGPGDRREPVQGQDRAQEGRRASIGSAPSWSRRSSTRASRATARCARPRSRACARTSPRPRSRRRRPRRRRRPN